MWLLTIFLDCISGLNSHAQEINLSNIASVLLSENAIIKENAKADAYFKNKGLKNYKDIKQRKVYDINGITLIILAKNFTEKIDDLKNLKQAYDYMNGGNDPNSKLFSSNNALILTKLVASNTELNKSYIYSTNKNNPQQTCYFVIAYPSEKREEVLKLSKMIVESLHFISD